MSNKSDRKCETSEEKERESEREGERVKRKSKKSEGSARIVIARARKAKAAQNASHTTSSFRNMALTHAVHSPEHHH